MAKKASGVEHRVMRQEWKKLNKKSARRLSHVNKVNKVPKKVPKRVMKKLAAAKKVPKKVMKKLSIAKKIAKNMKKNMKQQGSPTRPPRKTLKKLILAQKIAKKVKRKVMQKVQAAPAATSAAASNRSPKKVIAMEAHAYRMAAEMKMKEGNALAKLATLTQKGKVQKSIIKAKIKTANDKTAVKRVRRNLRGLVGRAKRALSAAKARPFDKNLLKTVIAYRTKVKRAKQQLVNAQNTENRDARQVKKLKKAARPAKMSRPRGVARKLRQPLKKPGKNTVRHQADINHMNRKQVKYWANKKMKFKADTPLKKTKVMKKIFEIKSREAATLNKINELNVGINMKKNGVRAKELEKGKTVILNGILVKPN